MTTTFIIERLLNPNCSLPFEPIPHACRNSYYRLYQLKLHNFLSEDQYRAPQYGKSPRSRQIKSQLLTKRFRREPMNRGREPLKAQQTIDDQHGKRNSSVVSASIRRKKDSTILSTPSVSTSTTISTESRPKSTSKSKHVSPSTKYERVFSAPTSAQKLLRKKKSSKQTSKSDIHDLNNDLLTCNPYSYTQVSSSSQYFVQKTHHCARQSILGTIMSHLNKHTPQNTSKWDIYRDIDDKFSASLSPSVYRSFERIIL